MKHWLVVVLCMTLLNLGRALVAAPAFPVDRIPTATGDLEITFIGHGTLMLRWSGKVIHVDPWSKLADYSKLPSADLVLLTHHHYDHLDQEALARISTEKTTVIMPEVCAASVPGGVVLANGASYTWEGLTIEAVPAYNRQHMRAPGHPYHPKGEGNGYVLTLGDLRVYIAGDTEDVPEMATLRHIDVAFLPMNLPYTMTPEMVASAARAFQPKILYPYHYGETDPQKLVDLLADLKTVEVRIRPMK